jgi:hypothetical protein
MEKRMSIMEARMSIFDEQYRVIAIEGDRLVIRGILSGDVLTIVNFEPETIATLGRLRLSWFPDGLKGRGFSHAARTCHTSG